jgi:hypothetical protein
MTYFSVRWLSGQLYRLDRHGHPYDLAIVAYALHITNMPAKVKQSGGYLFNLEFSLLISGELFGFLVSEDAVTEPRSVATLAFRRSCQSAKSHPYSTRSHPRIGQISSILG